eukprot:TRINITY_DN6512_c0_g1_i1.p1 TRINITY_DN6512_c0_g1~~TRINITY_DN6512_c0_g1_i1.p1  ORF type:complete len:198 (+),score=45.28 TRINITY_DN6512_c0_g1_i1:1-594(+)
MHAHNMEAAASKALAIEADASELRLSQGRLKAELKSTKDKLNTALEKENFQSTRLLELEREVSQGLSSKAAISGSLQQQRIKIEQLESEIIEATQLAAVREAEMHRQAEVTRQAIFASRAASEAEREDILVSYRSLGEEHARLLAVDQTRNKQLEALERNGIQAQGEIDHLRRELSRCHHELERVALGLWDNVTRSS